MEPVDRFGFSPEVCPLHFLLQPPVLTMNSMFNGIPPCLDIGDDIGLQCDWSLIAHQNLRMMCGVSSTMAEISMICHQNGSWTLTAVMMFQRYISARSRG